MGAARQIGARVYIAGMALSALGCFLFAFSHWQSTDLTKFVFYLVAAVLASSLKVSLPGIEGTMSMNFLLTLLCIMQLGLPETLLIGLVKTMAQFYWKPVRQLKLVQLLFNFSQVTVGSALTYAAYKLFSLHVFHGAIPLALLVAAITHFAFNTAAMSIIIGLTEDKRVAKVWTDIYLWSFPYYLVGAAIAGLVNLLNGHIGWQASLLLLPPIYLLYRSYRLYLSKLEVEKQHAEKVSNLHLRTIEALALAIEAKDQTTGEHLQRVRVYAMEVARELGLSEDETEALQAASVLHDIGKLAVPEHIISKPGKLTPDQQLVLDRQRARYGLLADDYNAIEVYGRELVKADPRSGPGHLYLGEAALGKNKTDLALREFVTARALYKRQNPDAVEQPVYLNLRIGELLKERQEQSSGSSQP